VYKNIIINCKDGWGGPINIHADETKNIFLYGDENTEAAAVYMADLYGGIAVNADEGDFKDDAVCCAVINRGDVGPYLAKGIKTVNLHKDVRDASTPSESYITGTISVVELSDGEEQSFGVLKPILGIARGIGTVVELLIYGAGQALKLILESVVPCFLFISLIVGIVLFTGVGDLLSNILAPYMGNLLGLLVVTTIVAIPFFSPILASGAAFAAVTSILLGGMVASGNISPTLVLPVMFAITSPAGSDYVPVGMAFANASKEVLRAAYPAYLFSRLICAPITVLVAYGLSMAIGLYR
jgi:PTS system glucitol/sorbitol-specific IIB component